MLSSLMSLSGLGGIGTPSGTHTRYDRCPFCGGENCFCVYADHAYCHREQRSFSRQELTAYLHKYAPCTVTSFYQDKATRVPSSLRWPENEYRTTCFFFPLYGWTRENDPYVLCYDSCKQLLDIVFAEPDSSWITLLDTHKILNDQCKSIFIFKNIHQVLHVREMLSQIVLTGRIVVTCLPNVPDATQICDLPKLVGKDVAVMDVDTAKDKIFVNKLYQTGARCVAAPKEKLQHPKLWSFEYLEKIIRYEDFELLKQDKRYSCAPKQQKTTATERNNMLLTSFYEAYSPRKMTYMGNTYLLLNPNDADKPSMNVKSEAFMHFISEHIVRHTNFISERQVSNIAATIVSKAPEVKCAAKNIGNRWMRTADAIYVNANANEILEITPDNIEWKEQNSVNGIYFPEHEYGNFEIKPTEKTVREQMQIVFGAHNDDTVNPIMGAYMAILPFLTDKPHPIVLFESPEGSGKSFTAMLVREILDPQNCFSGVFGLTNKVMDIACLLMNKTVAIMDNTTSLKNTIANLLCEAATSTRISYRRIMTNEFLHTAQTNGIIVITGINPAINQSDLISRMLIIPVNKPKRYKDYDEIKYGIPELRFTILRVMQDIIKNYNSIISGQTTTRFRIFECLLKYALEKCGWGQDVYTSLVHKQNKRSTEILGGNDSLLDFLVNSVERGKRYSSKQLHSIITNKLNFDMTCIGLMRKINSLVPALERAGIKLTKIRTNTENLYFLEDMEDE